MISYRNVFNVGVSDGTVKVFEGQYKVNGMAYNSYLLKDEKIAVFDTVDMRYGEKWLENVKTATGGKAPDYLIVLHMEPDHSSNVLTFMREYKNAVIVSSAKSFAMMKNFFGEDFAERRIVIAEGDTLNLGKHELSFIAAPMVHWPEVHLCYDKTDKMLFSADAFGRFGENVPCPNAKSEARRYYMGIVAKYGAQVQALLKKTANLKINAVLPLHGEIITDNVEKYIGLYNVWSSYLPEKTGVGIFYTSVYGNTERAVLLLNEKLQKIGADTQVYDLSKCDMSAAVAAAFEFDKAVFATTTYNMDVFPFMRDFLERLAERNYQNRKVALIENGSWAPNAAKVMQGILEKCKNISYAEPVVRINSAMSNENEDQISLLCNELN
ncbi:MAG: FprA family A-type flavoprotein [Clostridia bacterium]|nr:FprA family A-type flavoprotein [Clostridia bacterium]